MTVKSAAPIRRRLPVIIPANLFAVSFGLAGLAGCWRLVSQTIGAPAWVAAAISVGAAGCWLLVAAAWTAQLARRGTAFARELHDPVLGPFVSLVPIVGMLLALQLYPFAPAAGRIGFGVFAAATLLLGGWMTGQWIVDPPDLAAVHPGYVLPVVTGGLLAAQGAATVGWHGLADGLFGIGLICWLLLGSVIIMRLFARPPLPPQLSPLLAILIAPPAVAGTAYVAVSGGRYDAVAWALAGYAVLMALVQLRLIPVYRRVRFGPGYWSFTFSYAALATLALHWISHEHPAGGRAWTWAVLACITSFIAAIAVRTAVALIRGRFLPVAPALRAVPDGTGFDERLWEGSDPGGVAGFAVLGMMAELPEPGGHQHKERARDQERPERHLGLAAGPAADQQGHAVDGGQQEAG
jgi:tellurite resistance protein